MKEYNITLTEREIEALQICLCGMESTLREQAAQLLENNKTGINTNFANKKRERANECDALWKKLNDLLK